MSSHGFKGNGGGGDPPRDPKLETLRLQAGQPVGHLLPHQVSSDLIKAGLQAVKTTIVNRPIAPAPSVGSLGAHSNVVGAQVIAGHNLITKVPAGTVVSGLMDGAHAAGPAASLKPHPAVTVTLTSSTASTVGAGPTSLPLQVAATIQSPGVQMASLIRTGSLPAGSTLAPSGVTTLTQHIPSGGGAPIQASPHITAITVPQTHTFPSHIPRGAAAAASALSAPKPGAMAAAILRQAPQISYSAQGGVGPRMPMTAQARAFLPVRPATPTTPPVTRPTSPASLQTQEGHRPLIGTTTICAAQTGTAQNTVHLAHQPPKAIPVPIEGTTQRLLSELRTPKPHVQTSLAGAAGPLNPRAGLQAAAAKLITGQAYSLSHNLQRQPKILVSQPSSGPTLHSQQAAGPQATLQQNSINSAPAKTLAGNLSKQKLLMSPSSAIAALQSSTMLSSHAAAASPILSLGHQVQRQQKMVVSQVTMTAPTLKSTSNVTASKQGAAVVTVTNTSPHITTVPVTTAVAPVSSLPIAKVPPQRQVSASPQHIAIEVTRPETSTSATAPAVFLPHAAALRSSSSPAAPSCTSAINLSTGYVEARGQERPNAPFSYSNLPNLYGPSTLLEYSNPLALQFPQQVAAYTAQTLTSLPQATALRGVLPNQTPNLAATLQAATAQSVSSSGGSMRLNPMMVTVDPSRHPQLPLQTQQFAATSEGVGSGITHPLTSSTMTTVVNPTGGLPHPQPAPSPSTNITASPRPSILRKRTSDCITVVKKNLLGQLSEVASDMSSNLSLTSPKSSIHDPSRENSQSSTDTATSTESTPQPPTTPELRIKQEPMDGSENGSVPPSTPGTPSLPNSMEASPRKKPRKQLLNATQDVKEEVTSEDEGHEFARKDGLPLPAEIISPIKQEEQLSEFVDGDGIRWVAERKRPNISLLNHYQLAWKPRNNHFVKHSDVKPKEERRPTVNELANQRGIIQKASGWKMYHLAAQMEDMEDMEEDINSRILAVQETIAPKHIAKTTLEDDVGMVHELTQGNIQRSRLVIDQLQEARAAMIKILDHKKRINEIIHKHHSKRPVKKKERT